MIKRFSEIISEEDQKEVADSIRGLNFAGTAVKTLLAKFSADVKKFREKEADWNECR
jgi:hypothetical protein